MMHIGMWNRDDEQGIYSNERYINMSKRKLRVKQGVIDAVPIVVGYLPVGVAFGLIARNEQMPLFFTVMLSAVIFAGASQFMAVSKVALGTHYMQIIIATFIMNFRHFIMSASMASRLEEKSKKYSPMIAFFVTDESYAVTSLSEKLHHRYLLAVQIAAYLSWNFSTLIGYFMGGVFPKVIQESMGITIYVLFAALLVPEIKKAKPPLVVALSAGGINFLLLQWEVIEDGWCLVMSMLIASLFGYLLFRKEDSYES